MFNAQEFAMHRMPLKSSVALSLLAMSALGALSPSEAANVDALAGAIGGQSSCGTFGTPAPIGPLFGAIFDIGNIGNGISDCSLQGSIQNDIATMGPVSAANSVIATVGGGPYTGSSSATAGYGTLGVAAHGDMLGITNTFGFSQSGGFAIFNDQLTFTSPTASNDSGGGVVYTFTVAGALTTPVSNPPYTSQNLGEMAVTQNGLSGGSVFTADTSTAGLGSILGQTSYPGFTSGLGSIQGTGEFSSVELPFIWGAPADLTVGLAAVSFPATGGTLDANLNAVLSAITVYDANGVVTDFNVDAASASRYTANGVISAVPEPPAAALLLAGLAMTGFVARRRRSH